MGTSVPRISVIVAAYSPGEGIGRVIESLDKQTLPQDQFETVIVDDGSPDDTYERLQGYAATRANMTVLRIENSGWPSRPRNVATQAARGEYVLYMDHDDSLYPDGLRRLVEYAGETGADLISPKESKTSDVWWCMPALAAGNASDIKATAGINRLLPMVPHKAYRRAFLLAHDIRFPEGRRMLWEDVYFNVEAYAKADRVAVLADTPVYLWHESASNNSSTYAATDEEFWDRLEGVLQFIDTTLAGPELATERRAMIVHQYQGRMLRRLGRALQYADPDTAANAVARARALQETFVPVDWDERLGFFNRPLAHLLRENRPDLLKALNATFLDIESHSELVHAAWEDGQLAVAFTMGWHRKLPGGSLFEEVGGRLRLRVPADVAQALPPEALDVTDRLDRLSVATGVRSRTERVTWEYRSTTEVSVEKESDGVAVTAKVAGALDPLTAAYGRPLDASVWNFSSILRWDGIPRVSAIHTSTEPLPALVSGLPAVAYANQSGTLSLDLSQRLRSPVVDGLRPGAATRTADGFVLPLAGVSVSGDTRLPIDVLAAPSHRSGGRSGEALPAFLVGDSQGARLEVRGTLPAGSHHLTFRAPAGSLTSRLVARADGRGDLVLEPGHESGPVNTGVRRLLGWVRAFLTGRTRTDGPARRRP